MMKVFCRSSLTGLLLATAFFLVVPVIAAGQGKPFATDDLTTKSEIVARGTVRELKAQWEGNRDRIVTYVTLDVSEYLKGQGGKSLTVVVPGGEIDGVGELYSHTAKFQNNEEAVVFAAKDRRGRFRVAGGNEGKFSVTRDDRTGKRIVANFMPLDDFKAQVDKSIRSHSGNKP